MTYLEGQRAWTSNTTQSGGFASAVAWEIKNLPHFADSFTYYWELFPENFNKLMNKAAPETLDGLQNDRYRVLKVILDNIPQVAFDKLDDDLKKTAKLKPYVS